MKDCQLEDLLDEHSRTFRGPEPDADWLSRLPEAAIALTPLLLLAREIAAIVVPIRPGAEFRRELRRSLLAEARQQQAQRTLELPMPVPRPQALDLQGPYERVRDWISTEAAGLSTDRRWVIGAAAVGSAVSLAGILTFVLTRRGRTSMSA